ncbi:hypothetical protein GCM10027425_17060 [Alteromonas gracilis]
MSSATWYEILGVSRDASAAEIKAAWRAATDRFEPGEGTSQFRLFNEAADVLLDPVSRAEYDATLPAVETDEPREEPVGQSPEPAADRPDETDADEDAPDEEAPQQTGATAAVRPDRTTRRGVPVWALALLTVLTVAAVVTAGVLWNLNRADAAAARAGEEAQAAAERALPLVLSYDYRRLSADRDRALPFLSDSYEREYASTFDQLIEGAGAQEGGAVQTKAVVKATVVNSAVERSTEGRARVVMFLDQSAEKNGGEPQFSLNRLAVSMVNEGGEWLVDDIVSY